MKRGAVGVGVGARCGSRVYFVRQIFLHSKSVVTVRAHALIIIVAGNVTPRRPYIANNQLNFESRARSGNPCKSEQSVYVIILLTHSFLCHFIESKDSNKK